MAGLTEATDQELLAACLRGEAIAWEALLDRYAALIYSIPLKYHLSPGDAADVFQSVCVTLIEKLDTVRAPRGLGAWLITTTRRQVLALIRRHQRDQARRVSPSGPLDQPEIADPDLLPEEELLALERHRAVRAAVSQLPANCRTLIRALFTDPDDRMSYQQLAERLGLAMNSLGPTRARCLDRLRQLLLANGYEP
jgi:RNA polymerase sigma factor (sigma-70 family)